MKRINPSNKRTSTLLAFALIPLSGFALDVYIPSLPDMALKLHATPSAIQFTLSIYMVSYGICQLLIGSVLDSFGRYLPCMISLLLFSISSFLITGTDRIEIIYLMRALQGIMIATIVVATRASFFDMYEGDQLKHYTSLFSVIWSAAPIIAPFIGGYLQTSFGWQANFSFLGYLSLLFFGLELILGGESLQFPHPFHFRTITRTYGQMIRTNDFTASLLILGLSYSMMLVYGMSSPFIIERILGYQADVTGKCSLVSGVSMMAGGLLAKRYILRPYIRKMKIVTGSLLFSAGGLLVLTCFYHPVYTLLAYVILLHTAMGFIFNTVFSYCLTLFPMNGGKASGLAGGGYIIFTSTISTAMVSALQIKSQALLGVSYVILALLILVVFYRTTWTQAVSGPRRNEFEARNRPIH